MEKKYLGNDGVINLTELQSGKMNLIVAPCGSGKTTFVEEKLCKYSQGRNLLYLIDSKNGLTAFKSRGTEKRIRDGEIYYVHSGITAMTYAGFAVYCQYNPGGEVWDTEDAWIVCDELQSVIKWEKIKSENAEDINWHEIAITLLHNRIERGVNVIAITATPSLLRKEFAEEIFEVHIHGELKSYVAKDTCCYQDFTQLLAQLPADKKGLIYVQRVSAMLLAKGILQERGLSVACVWSINNEKHQMEERELEVRTEILENERIPEDIQITIINAASETGLNIKSEIDYVVVHSTNEDTVIQATGRVRHDIDTLYLLTKDGRNVRVYVPDEFLNKFLDKKSKDELCEMLNLRNEKGRLMKWNSIKSVIEQSGYRIFDDRKNDKRYSVIMEDCA